MNRYVMCVVGLLVGTGCDWMKSSDARSERPAERTVAPDEKRGPQAEAVAEMNERDLVEPVTPMDQGNTSAETSISAEIRKGVMAEPSLSFTARNVKVITTGTRVTLRGPVKTQEEKTLIGALAMRATGVTEINNQLEVRP